ATPLPGLPGLGALRRSSRLTGTLPRARHGGILVARMYWCRELHDSDPRLTSPPRPTASMSEGGGIKGSGLGTTVGEGGNGLELSVRASRNSKSYRPLQWTAGYASAKSTAARIRPAERSTIRLPRQILYSARNH